MSDHNKTDNEADRQILFNLPENQYTISQICQELDLKTHQLRYWEERIKILQPLKGKGGRRIYRQRDRQLLIKIKQLLTEDGYTLDGVAKLLTDQAAPKKPTHNSALLAQIAADLRQIKERLAWLRKTLASDEKKL